MRRRHDSRARDGSGEACSFAASKPFVFFGRLHSGLLVGVHEQRPQPDTRGSRLLGDCRAGIGLASGISLVICGAEPETSAAPYRRVILSKSQELSRWWDHWPRRIATPTTHACLASDIFVHRSFSFLNSDPSDIKALFYRQGKPTCTDVKCS